MPRVVGFKPDPARKKKPDDDDDDDDESSSSSTKQKKIYIDTFKRTTIFAIGIALVAALLEDFDDTAGEAFRRAKTPLAFKANITLVGFKFRKSSKRFLSRVYKLSEDLRCVCFRDILEAPFFTPGAFSRVVFDYFIIDIGNHKRRTRGEKRTENKKDLPPLLSCVFFSPVLFFFLFFFSSKKIKKI